MTDQDLGKRMEEHMNARDKKIQNWPQFVESDALAFFNAFGVEKMTIEDGEGGKAKLTRMRDNSVKVDLTLTTVY